MKKVLIVSIIAVSCVTSLSAQNLNKYIDSITISIGQSKDDINIYRFGVRKDFEKEWAKSSIGYFSGYWELSANYWSWKSESNFGIALSPVFAYYFDFGKIKPYIEAGIGGSWWNKSHIKERNLGSHFNFEDRIGVGFRYKNLDFSFRYMHYSNAGIKKPNMGIDIFIGSVSFKF